MKKKLLSTCLLATALLVGCGEEKSEADVEACEHLQEGPAVAVTASATPAGAPAVNQAHTRHDVALVDVTGGKGGSVSFAATEAADYILFLGSDVPVAITNPSGQVVEPEEAAKSSSECTEVKGRYVVPMEVGTYTLTFGPTTQTSTQLVIEEAAHEDHED